ncbi:hypothetical protein M2336_001668 [Sphingobium sp. B1D7B]|uniref:hypothetical protein n=1 Tax=Sphingobium sp. B1D7B TaxID=2940578 RepID=UPI0022254CCD|nr:hypothetical protein [Sphingobium sp. B1D7B]MCW2405039.1 hypothetical protein [Sphingobium sp. B1D7B]
MSKEQPKSYKAPHDVYVGGKYYKAGEIFVTTEPKGDKWEDVGKAEKAATDAEQPIPGDAPIESLDLAALKALAATKHVNPEGMNKKDLIAAIKAANEPKL